MAIAAANRRFALRPTDRDVERERLHIAEYLAIAAANLRFALRPMGSHARRPRR